MAFKHRKLISASENKKIIIPDACEFFCDSTRNTKGYCTSSCTPLCPLVCVSPISSLIFPSPPPPAATQEKNPKLPLLLIISLSFLAAVCFLFCCYTIYKSYKIWDESRTRRRRRSAEAQQEESYSQFFDQDHGPVVDHPIWYIRTVGLQSSVINSIAICKYKRGDGLVEGTDCSVCLTEFREDEALRLLPKCNHAFHIPCIDTWLRSHTNCPLCRARIVSNPAGIPTVAPEQSVDNPGVREENPVVDSESRGEFRREREDGDCELVGIEEEGEREGGNFEKNLVFPEEEMVHQPMRRSVSMDSISASMISLAIADAYSAETVGNSGSPMGIPNKSNAVIDPKRVDANRSLLKLSGDSSIGRSPQKRTISMKRSLSCSGKVLFSTSMPEAGTRFFLHEAF